MPDRVRFGAGAVASRAAAPTVPVVTGCAVATATVSLTAGAVTITWAPIGTVTVTSGAVSTVTETVAVTGRAAASGLSGCVGGTVAVVLPPQGWWRSPRGCHCGRRRAAAVVSAPLALVAAFVVLDNQRQEEPLALVGGVGGYRLDHGRRRVNGCG